MVNNFDHLLTV